MQIPASQYDSVSEEPLCGDTTKLATFLSLNIILH
jgi:hypothetical protein